MSVEWLRSHATPPTYGRTCLWMLGPPYDHVNAWPPKQIDATPLGTILCGTGPNALATLGAVTVALRSCPWLTPAIVLPAGEDGLAPLIPVVCVLHDRIAVAHQLTTHSREHRLSLLEAIRRRPAPQAGTMSRYCATRSNSPGLLEPLTEQFAKALGATALARSVATYSRLFARHGSYTAHDWRSIAQLVHDLCAPDEQLGLFSDQDPDHDADSGVIMRSRTANRHARRYLSMSIHAAGTRLGWEWILERALRRGAYIPSQNPVGATDKT